MKNQLKISLFAIVALLGFAIKSNAQTEVCKIAYDYDAAGNRIKREYRCSTTWPIGTGLEERTIFTTVYPNPTTGLITGVFSEPIGGVAGKAVISISTMGGIVVLQQEFNYITTTINFDISQQIPGQYLLTVAAFNKVETYVITKL